MSKPRAIEKVKNVILVVLLLSTVLLLYFFWGNISFEKIGLPEEQIELEIPLAEDVIQPYRIVVNFGSENYTIIPFKNTDVWYNDIMDKDSIVEELNQFGQTENILLEEITYSKYQEAVMNYRSIRAEFNYYILFSDFCKKYEIKTPQSYNGIEAISSVGYSEGSPESLLIYDGKNHKYYRLMADSDHTDFTGLIASIEVQGYNTYYPISTYLGVDNSTLIPLDVNTNLKSFSFRQDAYVHQTEKINEMAKSLFGESFDFVRKITEDNGTIIYMYGYGQKVLIVNPDGSFEYKEEQLNENSSQQNYFDSLDIALGFVAAHGSWESLDGAKMTPYLKKVIIDPGKKKGYRFIFGMETNGVRLFYEHGETIIVEVTLGQVTYYHRNLIDFDQEEINAIEAASYDEAFSAVNLIAQNYEYIYEIALKEDGVSNIINKSHAFEEVANHIRNMEIGYLKPAEFHEADSKVRPVWVITVDDINIYFDLYSAEPVGYSQE